MKNLIPFALLLLFAMACGNDDDSSDRTADLFFDGPNQDAPVLEIGTHIAAARFPSTLNSAYVGKSLFEVDFHMSTVPGKVELIIYDENIDTEPGDQLYIKDITNDVVANDWNTHILDTPVSIENKDLWIALRLVHSFDHKSIGCDAGPANEDGDKIYSTDLVWKTFREKSNGNVDINWNIKGFVQ